MDTSITNLFEALALVESEEHSRDGLVDLDPEVVETYDLLLLRIHRVCHAVMNKANGGESRRPWTRVPIWQDVRPDKENK